ncbi:putative neurotransmitter-gated ion-channel ligand binding domain protein [Trichinella spiralis]|uniref:putative neurotransmitter-gated ion-channel ligand binding domain protein n=1 Tax=Trichinella spiralis TaxID=6334 RepID=UPI0001EFBEA9|nr:putative neurotransmitter-gated ion-channel ligand binding domain protein [Trichinella spiralis]
MKNFQTREWPDSKLVWDPDMYGGIKKLHIPADLLWTPDIVLYNNAAGDPEITIFNDALVYYDGTVVWKPPAIYKSFCSIDVTWFPYDSQKCLMKFGLWSYFGAFVDMRQLPEELVKEVVTDEKTVHVLEVGMDLSYFYKSAEWDLLSLTSERHEQIYSSCCGKEKYVDITFYFSLRRKTLFYTVNLIIPCFLISFATTLVFYLSDHKITFSISILVTLTVFFLVILFHHSINFSIYCSCLLLPGYSGDEQLQQKEKAKISGQFCATFRPLCFNGSPCLPRKNETKADRRHRIYRQLVLRILRDVRFIEKHFMEIDQDDTIASDWVFVGMVIDRLFLVIFAFFNVGTLYIILQAPTLYDQREPLSIPIATRPLGQDTLSVSYE